MFRKKHKIFSITDHNCIRAIEEAKEYCTGKDIEMISAIELDCTIDKTNLHVLGYGIDYHNPIFHEIEEFITLQERVASKNA
ncbi:hypothetical protein JQ038_05540 [Clostridium botulinum]|nr:hypothetical protein [Clostridium botulinum]MCS4482207.1 hypothetical protein [Clostridium botulinum]